MCDGSSIDGMSDDLNLKKLTGFQLCGSKIKGAVDELKADMTGAKDGCQRQHVHKEEPVV